MIPFCVPNHGLSNCSVWGGRLGGRGSGAGRWGKWKGLGGGRGVLGQVGETEVVEVGGGVVRHGRSLTPISATRRVWESISLDRKRFIFYGRFMLQPFPLNKKQNILSVADKSAE